MNKAFEIYYYDLTEEAQKRLREALATSDGDYWDVGPLVVIKKEDE